MSERIHLVQSWLEGVGPSFLRPSSILEDHRTAAMCPSAPHTIPRKPELEANREQISARHTAETILYRGADTIPLYRIAIPLILYRGYVPRRGLCARAP